MTVYMHGQMYTCDVDCLPEAAHGDAAQHVVSDELTYLLALVTRVVHTNVLERALL